MSYAIISVGGKQYRVHEGQQLLVDRLATGEGKTFTPTVLLVGGNGETRLSPSDVTVTAKVLGQERGPKIRIGKYRQRTGFKRHTGFRAALTKIEIESIGARKARATARPKAQAAPVEEKPTSRTRAAKPNPGAVETAAQKKPAATRSAARKTEEEG